MMKNARVLFSLLLTGALGLAACGDSDEDPAADGIPTFSISGSVLDFATGDPLDGQASITTDGLSPAPGISTEAATFTISNVPLHSVFQILASSPPDYRSTYNPAVSVTEDDIKGLELLAVSEAYITSLGAEFNITPDAGTGILIGQLVDGDGNPLAGVPGTAFDLDAAIAGPFFLAADRSPDVNLAESSASGYFVLYHIPEGLTRVTSKDQNFEMSMVDTPMASTAITLAEVVVGGEPASGGGDGGGGPRPIPDVVSFANDVGPAFLRRGCDACHNGGGIGKDLGGLHLNGDPNKMFREVAEETSLRHGTLRVDTVNPANSLLLTMPSREDPPDVHPNVTFASPDDPDYLLILKWIEQGALQN